MVIPPSHHPFSSDFPYQKPSILGYPSFYGYIIEISPGFLPLSCWWWRTFTTSSMPLAACGPSCCQAATAATTTETCKSCGDWCVCVCVTRKMNGKWMGYEWDMNGIWMAYEWDMSGMWMRYEWDVNAIWMGYEWDMNGIWVGYEWDVLGIHYDTDQIWITTRKHVWERDCD